MIADTSDVLPGDTFARLHTEADIKDIKERLEARFGVILSRTQPPEEYLLFCKEKGCRFSMSFTQIESGLYRYRFSCFQHSCETVYSFNRSGFLQGRKKLIDMKEPLYHIIKESYQVEGFKKPKEYMAVLMQRDLTEGIEEICRHVSCIDQKKLKKKFDNVVAEVKARVIAEDPEEQAKLQDQLRHKRKKKSTAEFKRLPKVIDGDEEPEEEYVFPKRSRKEVSPLKPRPQETIKKLSDVFEHSKNGKEGKCGKGLLLIKATTVASRTNKKRPSRSRTAKKKKQPPVNTRPTINRPVFPFAEQIEDDTYQVEYEIEEVKPTVLRIRKDFVCKEDEERVSDISEWRKINLRFFELEVRRDLQLLREGRKWV